MEAECSIDFARLFSLPVLVPPLPTGADRVRYLGDGGVSASFLHFSRPNATDESDFDAAVPGARRVRSLARIAGGGEVLVPRAMRVPPGTAARAPTLAQIDKVGTSWKPATPQAGRTLPEIDAATFRWDQHARHAAAAPLPVYAEETLLLSWPAPPPAGGLLPAPIPGIVADANSAYSLATSNTARDGELDPRVLRAPVRGPVRFDRYRHLLRISSGALQVLSSSSAGRLLIRGIPHGKPAGPDGGSPLLRDALLVLENVDVASAIECCAALVVAELVHFDDIRAENVFDADLRDGVGWLFRSWLAYLAVLRPVLRPGDPDPSPGLDAGLRTKFGKSNAPALDDARAMIAAVRADPASWSALVSYIQTFFAPLLCGRSWRELGADFPVAPASRPPALRAAHAALEELPHASGMWLVAFAGAPLGRPATIYAPASVGATPPELLSGGVATFEAEALAQAGSTGLVFPGVALSPSADIFSPPDLTPLAANARGAFAGLRLIDHRGTKIPFMTSEWLAELVQGANRAVRAPPRIDFAADAAAGHVLAGPLDWDLFTQAQRIRADLDTLNAARIGADELAASVLRWWVARTHIADAAGNWPVALPDHPPGTRGPPSPRDPFRDGATAAIGGFDEFDLLAALRAQQVLHDAKELAPSIPLPVILALLDVEGYRTFVRIERQGSFVAARQVPDGSGGVRPIRRSDIAPVDGPNFQDAFARVTWVVFPYGMDVVNAEVTFTSPAAFAASERLSFLHRIDNEYVTRTILPAEFSSENCHRFVLARLEGRFNGPLMEIQDRRISRRLQHQGLMLQQAEFQVRHFLLYHADAPGSAFLPVAEMIDPLRPDPGADANSVERRDWLAYWALVYLAFNLSPSTFNEWVSAAPAGTRVSTFLVYLINADPDAVEPVPPPVGARRLYQRANMIRFAVALDAYARLLRAGAPDTADPAARVW